MDELFDDELRNRLKKYSEEPDPRLWNIIVARNVAEQRAFTLLDRKRIGFMIIAGLLLMSGLYYLINPETIGNAPITLAGSLQKQEKPAVQQVAGVTPNMQPEIPQKKVSISTAERQHSSQQIQQSKPGVPVVNVGEVLLLPTSIENSDVSLSEDEIPITSVSETELSTDGGESIPHKESNHSVITEITAEEKKVAAPEKRPVYESSEKKGKRFNIYFTIMPTFGYQRINSNSNDNIIIESIDKISTFSIDRLGVRAELGAEDPITDRIKVFGGLVYYQRKQTIGFTEKQVDQTQVTQGPSGDIVVEPKFVYVDKSFEYELRNLGMQVGLSYQLSKRKLLQTVGTGIEFHIALKKLKQNNQSPEFTNNPSAYVFYNLYYRLQYPAEGRLKAVLQPTLNYSLYIDQNLNAPFYVKPYGLGLNIGCTYNF